jgi:hypothetical protein
MMGHANVRRRKPSFVEFLDSLSGVCIVFKVSRDGFGSNLILGHNFSPFLGDSFKRAGTPSEHREPLSDQYLQPYLFAVFSRLA